MNKAFLVLWLVHINSVNQSYLESPNIEAVKSLKPLNIKDSINEN